MTDIEIAQKAKKEHIADIAKKINIPDLFTCYNQNVMFDGGYWGYKGITSNGAKPSDCIKCGKCEKECPQHLPIRSLMEDIAKKFE